MKKLKPLLIFAGIIIVGLVIYLYKSQDKVKAKEVNNKSFGAIISNLEG